MNSPPDIFVSVLTVVNNDADAISDFLEDTAIVLSKNFQYYEILIVDNGSQDDSSSTIRALQKKIPNIRLLRLSRAYDKETALAACLDNSIGDYVIIMDLLCDPPDLIPGMIQQAVSGFDVVIAESTDRGRDSRLESWLRKIFYKTASRILGQILQPQASYFRVLSRRVVNSLTRIRNKSRYFKYFTALVGFRQVHIPYQRVYRCARDSGKSTFLQSLGSALDIILSNSARPLRWAAWLGLLASSINLFYIGYIFIVTLVKRRIAEGWLTTNVMSTLMFFFLFLILTVLAEYVSRILEETKDRPLYFIDYEIDSPVMSYKEGKGEEPLNVV
ncbi:MAG: glycosyltransferase [Thermodesulfobacteriota bacterium]